MEDMVRSLKGLYHLLSAFIAACWYRFPTRNLTVIGVTGTDGKTTTATLIYDILRFAGLKASMISSVSAVIGGKTYETGFHVTTPGAFRIQKYLREAADHGDAYMVLEATSHGLSQFRLFGVRFRVGVITNISREHLDWHRTFDRYLRTKLSLLRRSDIVVVNRDEEELSARAMAESDGKKVIGYGMRRHADVMPHEFPFTTTLLGDFNRYNILAALAVTVAALGVDKKTALTAVSKFRGVPGRLEVVRETPFRVVIDFAHTPNAIHHALKTVKALTKKRLIHVFGSAGLRDREKRPMMGKASGAFSDVIILTEEDYRTENVQTIMDEIASGIPDRTKVLRIADRARAIDAAIREAQSGDTVIITGKSHEKSLCRRRTEYPWDEKAHVLRSIGKKLKLRGHQSPRIR